MDDSQLLKDMNKKLDIALQWVLAYQRGGNDLYTEHIDLLTKLVNEQQLLLVSLNDKHNLSLESTDGWKNIAILLSDLRSLENDISAVSGESVQENQDDS